MKAGKNQQVIMRLIDAVSDNDKERVLSFLAENTVLQNKASKKCMDQQAIRDVICGLHSEVEKIDWHVDQLTEDESGKVLTRGCLRYRVGGQWSELPVNGAFEVKGSKVIHWC